MPTTFQAGSSWLPGNAGAMLRGCSPRVAFFHTDEHLGFGRPVGGARPDFNAPLR